MTHLYILSFRDCFFFFNDTATTEIYTLSLHDALPIYAPRPRSSRSTSPREVPARTGWLALTSFSPRRPLRRRTSRAPKHERSEEHTSELQSRQYLVCRLLLEKKRLTSSEVTHSYALLW